MLLLPLKRFSCKSLAAGNPFPYPDEFSEFLFPESLSKGTGTTSICISILSSRGPDILFRYFCTIPGGKHNPFQDGCNSRRDKDSSRQQA
jgi:hypothetical protein